MNTAQLLYHTSICDSSLLDGVYYSTLVDGIATAYYNNNTGSYIM